MFPLPPCRHGLYLANHSTSSLTPHNGTLPAPSPLQERPGQRPFPKQLAMEGFPPPPPSPGKPSVFTILQRVEIPLFLFIPTNHKGFLSLTSMEGFLVGDDCRLKRKCKSFSPSQCRPAYVHAVSRQFALLYSSTRKILNFGGIFFLLLF